MNPPTRALLAVCASLATAGAAQGQPIQLAVDNTTRLAIEMPGQAAAADGCTWRGPPTLLEPGDSGAFTIAPADDGSPAWPCRLSLQAPVLATAGSTGPARLHMEIGAPVAGRLSVGIDYAYRLGGRGAAGSDPWVTQPVMLSQLQAGPDGSFRLDLTPLADWIAQNRPE